MTIEEIFSDKSIKAKSKVIEIGNWLNTGQLSVDELLAFCEKQIAPNKATCIEAIEYATKKKPTIANEIVFSYVTKALLEDDSRIKWESAKVIANIAHLFPSILDNPIANLMVNTSHSGTVVRWATALALGEILKLKTKHNEKLIPFIETICSTEEDSGVKKKYSEALKKVKK